MRKSYKFAKKKKDIVPKFRYNNKIFAHELRVIDENNEMLGVLSKNEALQLAQERGFDLVEVSPKANPPVAKFLDFGKFQYQQEKLVKKQKKQVKKVDTKGIRLSAKISDHDLETRANQARKFLEKGDKVKIELILRGREHQHKDAIKKQLHEFAEKLNIPYQVEQEVSKQGSKLFMIITPVKDN